MKENQFTYLQLVYSRVIHYPSLPISESPQRKFENSSIPIKKIQTLKIQRKFMYDRFQSEPFIKIHLIFTFHQHDLHNYFPREQLIPALSEARESARKWTGAIIRECNLTLEIAPSPPPSHDTSASWRNPFAKQRREEEIWPASALIIALG